MRHLSLFTGSGIGTLAAQQCGIETVAQCENDPACQFALRKLWPDAHLFEDIHGVSAKTLWECGAADIDIISGGFPCQDLSCAGTGAGIEGSRSGLWREMFRIIRQVRSRWILIENVPALRLRGSDRVLAPLERIGYTVWPLVVGAWSVGAPHKRDRVWIVGRRSGQLGDTHDDGLRISGRAAAEGTLQRCDEPIRRPARPAEPQHPWEAPRLIEQSLGGEFDGFPARVQRRANKAALRVLGNAWCYQNAIMIFRWIAEQEK